MGKSKDLATGASYVDTSGDTMTGNLGVNGYIDLNTSGNRAKLGYDSNNVYIGSTSGTGALYFKNNITSSDAPHSSGDTKMIISDNAVTMPNQPSFSAYRDAGHVTSGNVVVFNHTNYNIGNMYDTSNGKATVLVDGRYFLGVWLMTQNDATYDNKYFRIRINNSNPAYKNVYSSNGGSVHHQFSWAGVIDLNANDYVEIYIDNFTAYGVNSLYSNFSMHLLS